jgi:hypothetical protein
MPQFSPEKFKLGTLPNNLTGSRGGLSHASWQDAEVLANTVSSISRVEIVSI